MEGGVGPTTTTTTSNSHSRPVRASRFHYNNNNNVHSSAINHHSSSTFTGPVRKWEKKWVHVSSSKPSTTKQKKQSNGGGSSSSKSPILLCKWTPLSKSTNIVDDDGDDKNSVEVPKRKFRYTPIAVYEAQKKLAVKRAAENNESGESHQSAKRVAMDADDIYGMLDMNHDLMGADQEPSKSFAAPHSSSRSHFNLGFFSENQNQERQLDAVEVSGF